MPKTVILVGHCSPDSSYLAITVKALWPDAAVHRANSTAAMERHLQTGADLLLVNRALDGDFDAADGIELISRFSARGAGRMMLISNYSDAQADAIKAGALPGFGKSELSTAKPRQMLASALAESKLEK